MQSKKIVIAIDKSLTLVEDELVSQCNFLCFNALIDVVSISNSGNVIICGLRDGEIHGIFIKGIPLLSLTIRVEDVNMTGRTFTSIQQIGQKYYVCCSNGSVYW